MANEIIIPIPARLKNVAKGGHVAGAQDIVDDELGKTQKEINAEQEGSIAAEVERATEAEANLDNEISALQKQDIEVVADHTAITNPDPKTIYREQGEDSYTDWMYQSGAWKDLATYSFPGIDDEPTDGSDNLVKSGSLFPLTEISYKVYNCDGFVDNNFNISPDSSIYESNSKEETMYDCYNCNSGSVDTNYNISPNTQEVKIDRYVLKEEDEIDDSYLGFFSEEEVLAESIGTLTGFPVAFVHNGIIYVFFDYNTQHQPTPGEELDDMYYMYSKDGGETWSEIKTITFPGSTEDTLYEGERIYYNYRYIQPVSYNNSIIALGYIVPSTSNAVCSYRPFFCRMEANEDGDLSYSDFSYMPYVEQDGSSVTDPVLPGYDGSNVVAGNTIVIEGVLYWCYYTSWRNVVLCSWTINEAIPNKDTVHILKKIGDNWAIDGIYQYSEVGMFYARGYINLSIRNENGRNCNYTYDMTSGTCQKVCTTERRCFGPVIYKPENYPAVMAGRQYGFQNAEKSRMDNLVILDDFNKPIVENIGFVGHYMGPDSMYCSIVDYDDKLFIFYYYGTTDSQVHVDSHYTLAYKTIEKKYIDTLF